MLESIKNCIEQLNDNSLLSPHTCLLIEDNYLSQDDYQYLMSPEVGDTGSWLQAHFKLPISKSTPCEIEQLHTLRETMLILYGEYLLTDVNQSGSY